ncbi:MAG TPA: CCA tRNA nucleotidyltransferase [Candidatus Korarchaeota archaeon]|nr:CCA tRNA nucleotidyltransferase [Candidatus Korarchaeota archaeon]
MEEDRLISVIRKVSELLTPSLEEKRKALKVLEKAVDLLNDAATRLRLDVSIVPVGSITRDTWLPGKTDLDIFVLFKRSFPEEKLGEEVINLAKEAFGRYTLRYSAHPYARVKLSGFEIDVVPAYEVKEAVELRTPVDRSPLHARFLEERMTPDLAREARLLKAFVKGMGAYGAEVRVEGFSGYLCELLVLYYGSFLNVIRAAVEWEEPVVIDMTKKLGSMEEAKKLFPNPLIVIDPIDPRRNVASALSRTQFYRFKAAAKAFLKNPSKSFFERKAKLPDRKTIQDLIDRRGTYLVTVLFEGLDEAPDTLWTQAKSAARKLQKLLRNQDFQIIHVDGYTNESSSVLILVEASSRTISPIEIRGGPEVGRPGESDFIKKHLGSDDTISGPFISENRWFVLKRRKCSDVKAMIEDMIRSGEGLPKKLGSAKSKKIFDSREISKVPEWALGFIYRWLKMEEPFLKELSDP